jgi:hypothetical protein
MRGRIHLFKHYQAERREQEEAKPNLAANKI